MCGYTYPEIDEMTLPQVYELMGYWTRQPPLHILFADWVGLKRPSQRPAQPPASKDKRESFKDFMRSLGVNLDALPGGNDGRPKQS